MHETESTTPPRGTQLAGRTLSPDSVSPDSVSPDADLLARARAGDADAFTALVEQHDDVVRGLLRQLLGPRAELDDLVAEARLKALRGLPGFRGASAFSTWFSRIAMNVAISALRRRRTTEALPEQLEGGHAEPWVQAGRVELRERLANAVARLPGAMSEAFDLHYRQGLDSRRISERLGVPAATVRTRLFHARRRLREALDDLVSG